MTTLDDIRLHAYLERIGHPQPGQPDLAALDSLIAAHLEHIPFENVDVLLGRPIRIGLDAVFDKLVTQARGGYCFEQNTLLAAVLRTLGYGVTALAARVRWNVPDDVPTMQSHMLLRVEAAHHSYIVDVGFGGPNPYRAMPLPQTERADAAFPYRLAAVDTPGAAFHLYDRKSAAQMAGSSSTDSIFRRSRRSISNRATGTPQPIPTACSATH